MLSTYGAIRDKGSVWSAGTKMGRVKKEGKRRRSVAVYKQYRGGKREETAREQDKEGRKRAGGRRKRKGREIKV